MAIHMVQFPSREEYGRAMTVLSEVNRTRVGLPDFKMVIEDEHLEALKRSGIPYTELTKRDALHGTTPPVQP